MFLLMKYCKGEGVLSIYCFSVGCCTSAVYEWDTRIEGPLETYSATKEQMKGEVCCWIKSLF